MQKIIVIIIIVFLASVILGALFIIFTGAGGNDKNNSDITKEEVKDKKEISKDTLLMSFDGGENFKPANVPGKMIVQDIFMSKKEPGRIFLITLQNGIFIKEKGKDDWKQLLLKKAAKGSLYYYIAEDYEDNIYISYYSDNKGRIVRYNLKNRSEEEIFETPLTRYAVFGIQVLNKGKIIKIVSSDGGLYQSADFGYSWKIIKRFKEGLLGLTENEKTGEFFTETSEGKILKFGLNGTSAISDISADLKRFDKANIIKDLTYDENSEFLYLASGHGVLKSKEGEDLWETLPLILPPESFPVEAVAVNPYDINLIYTGSRNEFYKSDDNGESWRIINLPTGRVISKIEVDLLNPKIIYIGLK